MGIINCIIVRSPIVSLSPAIGDAGSDQPHYFNTAFSTRSAQSGSEPSIETR
jgi:hypothetical protein